MIFIAHGTGIAPFISILTRIHNVIATNPDLQKCGSLYMFYGCRNDDEYFIYKDLLLDMFGS